MRTMNLCAYCACCSNAGLIKQILSTEKSTTLRGISTKHICFYRKTLYHIRSRRTLKQHSHLNFCISNASLYVECKVCQRVYYLVMLTRLNVKGARNRKPERFDCNKSTKNCIECTCLQERCI